MHLNGPCAPHTTAVGQGKGRRKATGPRCNGGLFGHAWVCGSAVEEGGGGISISNLMNSEVRSNLQVQWVKLSVGHWRIAANPLLCIPVAYPQASSCLLFCDRKGPMVL